MKSIFAPVTAAFLLAAGCASPAATPAAGPAPGGAQTAADQEDPFLWLEEVEGARAMQWVEGRNVSTLQELSASPTYDPIFNQVLQTLNSRDRIAFPSIMGDRLYNFWQDAANPRGVWRRTTWESYLSGSPAWETVLDVDALAAAENVNWSYGGASCLEPEYQRCLVRLSRGGADAVEVREFDVGTRRFIDGGFRLPEAKQSVAWLDRDALLVATDFGAGSMTASGYARVAKLWRRGTPLSAARTLFEGEQGDVSVSVGTWRSAERTLHVVTHRPSFFQSTVYVLENGEPVRMELPMDADRSLVRDRLVVYLRSAWETGGRSFPAGSLIHIGYDDFVRGSRDFGILLQPADLQTVNSVTATRDYLLVSMLDNVRGELRRYQYRDGRWSFEPVPAPAMGSIGVAASSPLSNRYFFTYSGFTQPTTLYLAEENGSVREVRRMPAMFNAAGLAVEQHEARSRDGTRVPYFVVRPDTMRLDGTNPTLLYAYGGFEVSQTPGYSATTGGAWLERGGVYVLANIRGGGEFGPEWHRSALLENRQRAYDDFIAV
ncbi:MAG: prolyl oligopeptidase family serine peptidase, partial [Gemmatimonadota bacterium]|nr:prolyl oligopeptidase family serine peptidase [Gemmatimonadota bacterium]